MMRCWSVGDLITQWIRDYDRLQSVAVILLYIQIACALVGSLGAQYNGVLLINLSIALFALVAIESSSQSLGRTYAVLLFCAILLDVSWFILFTHAIWFISSETHGELFIFSVKLTLAMQIVGFTVRLASSFLWIQIYRLGVSDSDTAPPRESDFDLRHRFLNPVTPAPIRQSSDSDVVLGGTIFDPPYYSSLFEDSPNIKNSPGGSNNCPAGDGSASTAEASRMKSSVLRSFEAIDVESTEKKSPDDDAAS
ncbi:uncharacterized protein LOC116201871 [Punica granatum]|uniref:Uncharacterized protein LOC116201871 n=2 Tax=Punica granatum TaxID=22663 RepID=A0A6P8CWR5_PUNGR|nr:uncharacterized protein LOC116201871 [Punica granatum]